SKRHMARTRYWFNIHIGSFPYYFHKRFLLVLRPNTATSKSLSGYNRHSRPSPAFISVSLTCSRLIFLQLYFPINSCTRHIPHPPPRHPTGIPFRERRCIPSSKLFPV